MKRLHIETGVGIFMVIGFLCFAYLSIRLGDIHPFGGATYLVRARFDSISGLKTVEIAGVKIGKVAGSHLDPKAYQAVVDLALPKDLRLQQDSIASIRTAGIIGDRYVNISPGGLEEAIPPKGEIVETESAINLEEMVSKYIFEKK